MNLEAEIAELVVSARRGSKDAFGRLVQCHQSELRNFMRRLTREDWQLADELAQDAFLQAYRSLARLEKPERFRSWLFSIAYRKFIDHSRSRRAQQHEVATDELDTEAATSDEGLGDYETLLTLLPTEDAAVIDLVYRKGMSHSEAAQALRLPLGTVKTRVRGALQTLQQRLKGQL